MVQTTGRQAVADFPVYQPMRSLIYVDCAREEYRPRLQHWLYHTHIPDSISQFGPYVSKYAFYNALPTPPEGERFGTVRMQLTEHYWNINPMGAFARHKAFTEVFPLDVLRWQGNVPDTDDGAAELDGDDARASGGDNGMPPFIFAFVPVWWEDDLKGEKRTIADGPNYRWQFVVRYPDGVPEVEGDAWLMDRVLPWFKEQPEVTRILSSRVIQSVNGCSFQRVVEMWFEGPEEWQAVIDRAAAAVVKPEWAQTDLFPYLTPSFNIASIFLTDIATNDNFSQYRGYITMR